jgi:hypothetical protein
MPASDSAAFERSGFLCEMAKRRCAAAKRNRDAALRAHGTGKESSGELNDDLVRKECSAEAEGC